MMQYEHTGFPQKNRSLFVPTGKKHEVAQIGQGDMLSQFSDYTTGYLYSAIALIEKMTDDSGYDSYPEDIREERIQRNLDECAMPVCFLFRQYLELTLKDIYIQYSLAPPEELQKMISDVGHDLMKAWHYAKPIIESVLEDEDRAYFDGLESYVVQFHQNDKFSMKYRYPIDKKLQLHSGNERINLINLKKRMEEIEYFLPMCILSHLDIEKIKKMSTVGRDAALKLWDENKLPEAIACYVDALKTKQSLVGEEHYDVFIGNAEIGIIYLQNEQLKEAHEYLSKALNIYEKIKGSEPANDFDISIVLNYIGLIYKSTAKYKNAIEYYTQALGISNAGIEQKIIAYEGIARVFKRQKNISQATENYNNAINLSTENYGAEHEMTIKIIEELRTLSHAKEE